MTVSETITADMVDRALKAWFASYPSESDVGLERSMRAALTAALSDRPSGWQDISTAPKFDGRYVDLWIPERAKREYGRIPDCKWLTDTRLPGWYANSDEGMYYIGDGATHWRYRPESPPPSSIAGEVG